MRIRISTADGKPLYRQIIEQVEYSVASGRLAPGDELPSIRALAEKLLINPNTVARAYRELETSGLLTKRHGSGTYVSETESPYGRKERMRILAERADGLLSVAKQMDVDFDALVELLKKRDTAMSGE